MSIPRRSVVVGASVGMFVVLLACNRSTSAAVETSPSSSSSSTSSPAIANKADDEGPAEPQLWIDAERPTADDIRAVRFTADGRWLLTLDSEITVWELDAASRSLRSQGWFGLAVDRERPRVGSLTPENASAVHEQIERWKETHEGVDDFELLPDGLVVGAGDEGTLALWRLQPEREPLAERIAAVANVSEGIDAVDASRDGRWVLAMGRPTDAQRDAHPPADGTSYWQGIVQLWRVDPGSTTPLVAGGFVLLEDRPDEAFFTSDGLHAVVRASSSRHVVLALDGKGGMRIVANERRDDSPQDFAVAPDAATVVTADSDHTVRTWKLKADASGVALELDRVFHHHRAKVRDIAIAPDGRWCVANSHDKTMSVWPLVGLAADEIPAPIVFTASDDYLYGIDVHPHGPWIVTAGSEIRIWRVNRKLLAKGGARTKSVVTQRWAAPKSSSPVIAVGWSGDDMLSSLSADGVATQMKIAAARLDASPSAHASSREATRAAVALGDAFVRSAPGGALELVAKDGTSQRLGAIDGEEIVSVAAANDCIATGLASGRVVTWTKAGMVGDVAAPTPPLESASVVALSRDASLAVVAGTDTAKRRTVRLVAIDPGTCVAGVGGEAVQPPPIPSGDLLSSSSYPDGFGGVPRSAAFAPDGRWLATAEGDGAGALLWRVDAGARTLVKVGLLDGHQAGADAIAFAPDGGHVVTAGNDGELVLHRLELTAEPPIVTRLEYLPPAGPGWFGRTLAWSPSGRRLAAGGGWHDHGRLWVFELDPSRASPR